MEKNETLQNLSILLGAMKSDHLGKADFVDAFKKVISFIKKIEAKNLKEFQDINAFLKKFADKIESDNSSDIKKFKDEVSSLVEGQIKVLKKENDDIIKTIKEKLSEIKNGEDADEERVISSVLERLPELLTIPKIDDLKNDIPVLAEKIRDGLELLQGDDRLALEAIRDLPERLKELEEKIDKKKMLGGGGGTSDIGIQMSLSRLIRTETPAGTINGTNKVFTTTAEISSILSFAINGMVINDDEYTLSGNTITFTSAIPADLSGTSFRIKYI